MLDDSNNTTVGRFIGRVLVVEDEEVNRLVADGMMTLLGLDAEFAQSGREAIEKIAANRYDLIFMDVKMPEMDGVETTALIRRREFADGRDRTPIIALTAYAGKGERERCLDGGMDDYITKPLILDNLIETLGRWLGGQEDQGAIAEENGVEQIATDSPLDAARLAALGRSMRSVSGGVQRVLESYLESLERLPITIRTAVEHDDTESLARAAHSLKSNSAAAGALGLSALSADLEKAAHKGELTGIETIVSRIENEIGSVIIAVRATLK